MKNSANCPRGDVQHKPLRSIDLLYSIVIVVMYGSKKSSSSFIDELFYAQLKQQQYATPSS